MDWKRLFLSADGRIGRKEFWIGFLILIVVGFILGMIAAAAPPLGIIVSLVMIYPAVCLYSKRLHDMGKSGWIAAAPYVVQAIAVLIAYMTAGSVALSMLGGRPPTDAAALAQLGSAMLPLALSALFGLAFLLWVGLSKSDPGPNRYGSRDEPNAEVFT